MIYPTIHQTLYQLAKVQIVVTRRDKGWSTNTFLQRGMILADDLLSPVPGHIRGTAQDGADHDAQADQLSNIYHELQAIEKTCTFQEPNFSKFIPMPKLILEDE